MTREEFSLTKWTGEMYGSHQGSVFPIANCDFEEYTIGLQLKDESIVELPCESVNIVDMDFFRKGRFDTSLFSKLHSAEMPDIESKDVERLGNIMIGMIKKTSRTKDFINRRLRSKKKKSFKKKLRREGSVGEFLWSGNQ